MKTLIFFVLACLAAPQAAATILGFGITLGFPSEWQVQAKKFATYDPVDEPILWDRMLGPFLIWHEESGVELKRQPDVNTDFLGTGPPVNRQTAEFKMTVGRLPGCPVTYCVHNENETRYRGFGLPGPISPFVTMPIHCLEETWDPCTECGGGGG